MPKLKRVSSAVTSAPAFRIFRIKKQNPPRPSGSVGVTRLRAPVKLLDSERHDDLRVETARQHIKGPFVVLVLFVQLHEDVLSIAACGESRGSDLAPV